MKKKTFILSALLFIHLNASSQGSDPLNNTHIMTNKEKAIAVIESIETGKVEMPKQFINPNKYIQHNVGAPDGFNAELFEGFYKMLNGTGKAKVVRVFQDGDFVFAHVDYNFFGPKIGFDVFRFENGLIVEHWDNLQETPAQLNPGGHSMVDGETKIKDLDKTEANKELIRRFFKEIVVGGRGEKISEFIIEDVVQHTPLLPDKLSAALMVAGSHEYYRNMKDHQVKLLLGEGNFVLAGVECVLYDKPAVYYDLFRIENGLIVERWDVMETTLPKEQWKNKNGKF